MKKQLLLLPLVALLAGCNTAGGGQTKVKDRFANIRNTKISEETKQEILSNYHGFTLKNTMVGYQYIIGGSSPASYQINQIDTLNLTISSDGTTGQLEYLSNQLVTPLMSISYNQNRDPQYQGSVIAYPDANVEAVYKYCESQLFSWNCRYYAGLCAGFMSSLSEAEVENTNIYNYFKQVIEVEGDVKSGTFTVSILEPFTVSEFNVDLTTSIKEFEMEYRDYRLEGYTINILTNGVYNAEDGSRITNSTKTVAEITYK